MGIFFPTEKSELDGVSIQISDSPIIGHATVTSSEQLAQRRQNRTAIFPTDDRAR